MTLASALGAIGGIRTCLVAAMHRAHRATVDDRPGPIDVTVASEPIQQRKVDQIPHTGLLPIAQASPTGHPRAAAQFLRQHLPRNAAAQHERMPVRHARSETRGLPPFGRGGGTGKKGSIRSHNGSGSSAAAIPVHVTGAAIRWLYTNISKLVLLCALSGVCRTYVIPSARI